MGILTLTLIAGFLLGSISAYGAEVSVTRARSDRLTLDAGSEAGLQTGMEVVVVRPPEETVYHPLTGEKLGAPEIELGTGVLAEVSRHAATVRMRGEVLVPVRRGDRIRFTAMDGATRVDEERFIAFQEQNRKDHDQFREDLAGLTRSIQTVQGQINSLQSMVRRVERVEEGIRVQLRSMNHDLDAMKQDIAELRTQLHTQISLEGVPGEILDGTVLGLTREEVQRIVRQSIQEQQARLASGLAAPPLRHEPDAAEPPLPSPPGGASAAFYQQSWFIYLMTGVVGIAAMTAFFAMRMMRKAEEDEDEEPEEDDDALDFDIQAGEEDDIVVEETS